MPTAPQAKFQFVAVGDDVVNAQIQGVVDKLTAMQRQAQTAGKGTSDGMLTALDSTRLLNQSLGLDIPRALQKVIAGFEGFQSLLVGFGAAGGILAIGEVLEHAGEKVLELDKKWLDISSVVDEYNKKLEESVEKTVTQASSLAAAAVNVKSLTDSFETLGRLRARQAAGNDSEGKTVPLDPFSMFAAIQDQKNTTEQQFKVKDQLFAAQITNIEQQSKYTDDLISKEKQLNDTRLEGLPKILADEQSDINLADAKLANLQQIMTLENQRRGEANAANPTHPVPLIPSDTGQTEHATAVFYAKAQALAEISKQAREAQTTLLSFNDMLATANRQAANELQDDPYEKQLQELDSYWQKVIDETDKGAADKFKILQKDGIDTTNLQKQLDDTDYNLLSAHLKARTDLLKKQQQELLSGNLGNQTNIPKDLFVTNTDTLQMAAADRLLKQINADLQDESAQEALLKDQATTSGMTQIDLETKLQALRASSADKIQGLVTQLQQLGAAMLNGLGNPTVIAQADKLASKIDALRVKTSSWQIELKKGLTDDLENAFVGIVSGTETVSKAFETMATSILQQLAKIVFQMYVVKLLQAAIGGIGNLFGGGGGSGVTSGDPFTNSLFSDPIPHAMGGNVSPGQTYLVGERGPELLNVGSSGSITPNNMIGRGGAMPVQVNIHNYGQPMSQSQTSRFDGEKMIVDVVVKNMQNNGAIRQAMKS